MNIPEHICSKLTDEQKKKIETAETPEELLDLAKKAGYELSREQLESISGGKGSWCSDDCPFCVHGSCGEECTCYFPCGDFCAKYSK